MNKIWLIIKREFLTRVKKRSFIVMSVLGPVLFSIFMLMPSYLSNEQDNKVKTIAVLDSSQVFTGQFTGTKTIKYEYLKNVKLLTLQNNFDKLDYDAVLVIYPSVINSAYGAILYSRNDISSQVKENVTANIERLVQLYRLRSFGIDEETLRSSQMRVNLRSVKWNKNGTGIETDIEIKKWIAYIGGFLIYFFIFLFGVQVMRGVIEEKSGRIIEIIASSVKPFQLMMGKIVGIALVALVQFVIWIFLTYAIVNEVGEKMMDKPDVKDRTEIQSGGNIMDNNNQIIRPVGVIRNEEKPKTGIFENLGTENYTFIIGCFIFFFIGGYLLYGSLYAAIGSIVDAETDVQQFSLPVTLPLIFSVFILLNTMQDPNSKLSFIFSLVPLTSPIVMMARIPFDIPIWQVVLSAVILIISFLLSTWFAAKIYRTGILMYGKKTTYKELWKWLKYKG